jgi:MoxR-like ATPase
MTRHIRSDDRVLEYIRDIIVASRHRDELLLGGSPRASIALLKASKAYAAINGRDYVIPDDVKYLLPRVLSHRLIVKPELELENVSAAEVIDEILNEVDVPV